MFRPFSFNLHNESLKTKVYIFVLRDKLISGTEFAFWGQWVLVGTLSEAEKNKIANFTVDYFALSNVQ